MLLEITGREEGDDEADVENEIKTKIADKKTWPKGNLEKINKNAITIGVKIIPMTPQCRRRRRRRRRRATK